jgi:hypothetical protein
MFYIYKYIILNVCIYVYAFYRVFLVIHSFIFFQKKCMCCKVILQRHIYNFWKKKIPTVKKINQSNLHDGWGSCYRKYCSLDF